MSLRQGLAFYLCVLVVMLPLDVAWLSTMGRGFYKEQLGELLLPQPAWVPAAAFYLLYGVGVVVFAVSPAVRDGNWVSALTSGALLGLIAYGTYDLSNLATMRGFTTAVALVDLAWGAVVTALTAAGAYALGRLAGAA